MRSDYVELVSKLNELAEMWSEVAYLCNFQRETQYKGSIMRECIKDLNEVLSGDYTCIERIDRDKDESND